MNVSCKRINPYWHGTIYLKYISISIDWSEQLRSRGIFVEDALSLLSIKKVTWGIRKAKAGRARGAQGLPSGGIHLTIWAWLRICFCFPCLLCVFSPLSVRWLVWWEGEPSWQLHLCWNSSASNQGCWGSRGKRLFRVCVCRRGVLMVTGRPEGRRSRSLRIK